MFHSSTQQRAPTTLPVQRQPWVPDGVPGLDGTAFSIHLTTNQTEQLHSNTIHSQVLRHQGYEAFLADFTGDPKKSYVAAFTNPHQLDYAFTPTLPGQSRQPLQMGQVLRTNSFETFAWLV